MRALLGAQEQAATGANDGPDAKSLPVADGIDDDDVASATAFGLTLGSRADRNGVNVEKASDELIWVLSLDTVGSHFGGDSLELARLKPDLIASYI